MKEVFSFPFLFFLFFPSFFSLSPPHMLREKRGRRFPVVIFVTLAAIFLLYWRSTDRGCQQLHQTALEAGGFTGFITVTTPFGGLADRLRGIVSLYYVAKLFNRKLLVNEDILGGAGRNYLVPAKSGGSPFGWISSLTKEVDRCRPMKISATHILVEGYRNVMHLNNFSFEAFAHDDQVVDVVSNKLWIPDMLLNDNLRAHPGLEEIRRLDKKGEIWHSALRALFSPGPHIVTLLERIEADHLPSGVFKVGLHVRSGDAQLGDKKYTTIRNFTKRDSLPCFPLRVFDEWNSIPLDVREQKYPRGVVVFITTNDSGILAFLKAELAALGITASFDTETYASVVRHIDYASKGDDQTRTFLDWFLFTRMDLIIASHSGFSSSASRYRCTPIVVEDYWHLPHTDCHRWEVFKKSGMCLPSANLTEHLT